MIATAFSLCCFAAVLFVGAIAGQRLTSLFLTATGVLVVSHGVGLVIGRLMQASLAEGVKRYEQRNPAPSMKLTSSDMSEDESEQAESQDDNSESTTWDSRKRAAA